MRRFIHREKVKGERWHPCMCKQCEKDNKRKAQCRKTFHYFLKKFSISYLDSICSICGSPFFVVAHHPDYNKPFQVIWICVSCHRRIHEGKLHFSKRLIFDYIKTQDLVM